MLKLSIQLSESGSTLVLPAHLKPLYLELKKHKKAVDNASRMFRPAPKLPEKLKGAQDSILDQFDLPDARNKFIIDTSKDSVMKIGLNGKFEFFKNIKV